MVQVLLHRCGIAPSDVIAHQEWVDYMVRFTEILQRATVAVPAEYFLGCHCMGAIRSIGNVGTVMVAVPPAAALVAGRHALPA